MVLKVTDAEAATRPASSPATQSAESATTQADANTFAMYVLVDANLAGTEATKLPLDKLVLADQPLLTINDVIWYDARACRLFLTADCIQRATKELAPIARPVKGPVPVAVQVGGGRRFLAGVTKIEFVESVEVRIDHPDQSDRPIWQPYRRVWVCQGKDAEGKPRETILRDTFASVLTTYRCP